MQNLAFFFEDLPDEIILVKVEGEINTISGEDLKKLVDHFQITGQRKIIMDMKGVTYLNSKALGVLSYALREMRRLGGDLKLCNLSSAVSKLFEITKLFDVFQLYESVEEAVSAYGRDR